MSTEWTALYMFLKTSAYHVPITQLVPTPPLRVEIVLVQSDVDSCRPL